MNRPDWRVELPHAVVAPLLACVSASESVVATPALAAATKLNLDPFARNDLACRVLALLAAGAKGPVARADVVTAAALIPLTTTRRAVRSLLRSSDHQFAVAALARVQDEAVVPALLVDLTAADRDARLIAATRISAFHIAALRGRLIAAFDTEADVEVRFWLAVSLAGLEEPNHLVTMANSYRSYFQMMLGTTPINWDVSPPDLLSARIRSWRPESARRLREALPTASHRSELTELQHTLMDLVSANDSPSEEDVLLFDSSPSAIEHANSKLRGWLTRPPWFDLANAGWPDASFAEIGDPDLMGEAIAAFFRIHIEETRKIRERNELDYDLDDGHAIGFSIAHLVTRARLDIGVLFGLWQTAHWASKHQIAAVVTFEEPQIVFAAMATALGSQIIEERMNAAEFLLLALRYVGKAIPAWGGGEDLVDPVGAVLVRDDESTVLRTPRIVAPSVIRHGIQFDIIVDLVIDDDGASTITFPTSQDWTELIVNTRAFAPGVAFSNLDESQIIVRRSGESTCAHIRGTLTNQQAESTFDIVILFFVGGRYCGDASISISVDVVGRDSEHQQMSGPLTIPIDDGSALSVMTVTIMKGLPETGELAWNVCTTFDGLLDTNARHEADSVALVGASPPAFTAKLLDRIPTLPTGEHMPSLHGIGELLWERAGECFRIAYRTARELRGNDFAIQIVTNDPYIPWELMRPVINEVAGDLLCVQHPVGRMLAGYVGRYPTRIASTPFLTVAPVYSDRALPAASDESAKIVAEFAGNRLATATRSALLSVLESAQPLGILHFAGHGCIDLHGDAELFLEDGPLSVFEVRRNEVARSLHGSLVVLNACEVGGSGSLLGAYFGWAEAFSRARCTGFVGPLWSVDDDVASDLILDFLRYVLVDRFTAAEALQRARAKHAHRSATALAYVFVGDVAARLGGT